jgi:5-keto-L-gluconate epimerase
LALKYSVTAAKQIPDTAPILLRGDFFRCIEDALEIGYRYMEIHLRHAGQVDGYLLKSYCEERGPAISTIGTGMGYTVDRLSLTDGDSQIRKLALERLIDHIDLGAILNCGVIIGSMKGSIAEAERYKTYENYCLEGMKRLAEHAGSRGIPLYLECINRYELNYLNTVEETLAFIEKLASPDVKILVDTFHMNIEEPDIVESILLCRKHLGHVHLADSNRRYPGAGHIDFKAVVRALGSLNYKGYAALECMACPDPLTAARKGLDYLTALEGISD